MKSGTTTPSQSVPENNDNKVVSIFPKALELEPLHHFFSVISGRFTWRLSYTSPEVESVYSTADRAIEYTAETLDILGNLSIY